MHLSVYQYEHRTTVDLGRKVHGKVKTWKSEVQNLAASKHLKWGCFSWIPWAWATGWRMWMSFVKPLHMQEIISPQACHGWCLGRCTRAFGLPRVVLGTWRVLEFLWKGNIQSQAQHSGCVFCWVTGSCDLYHGRRRHHHKDRESLGREGSSSIFAAFWLWNRRGSETRPAELAVCQACLTILEWNRGDSATYYCYFRPI